MQRKDLGDGGWENIGLRTGRDGSNRYEEDTIGTVEFEGCQKKSNVRSLSNFPPADTTWQRSDENYKKVLQSVMKETAQKCGWTK